MPKSANEILTTYHERKRARGKVVSAMQEIRDTYNGDVVIPLPEMDNREKPFVANLVAEGIDQQSMRIASVVPDVRCPPLREGYDNATQEARTRRLAYLSWWDASRMGRKLRRRARHLVGYGLTPAYIRPDFKRGIPVWEVENPMGCFPAEDSDPDNLTPTDVIFTFNRSYGWLKQNHPSAAVKVRGPREDPNQLYELLRYVDAEEIVLLIVRQMRVDEAGYPRHSHSYTGEEIERFPNRAGVCTATAPGRVTLDRIQGAFDGLVGMYVQQARLQALEVIAVEKAIFPDIVLVSGGRVGTPRLVNGQWFDGRTGKVNQVADGGVQVINAQPGFATDVTIDRLERNQRITGGIPAAFGGEGATNIRTGRAGSMVLSAAIDFRIQEHQETLQASLEEENRIAMAVARGWFGAQKKTFYVNFGERVEHSDYVPNDFKTDANRVFYPMAGADANAIVVGIGQRIGVGLMSKRTGRQLDPMTPDYELEEELVNAEDLERIAMTAFESQASQGAVPLVDVARVIELVRKDKLDVTDALLKAQQEAQERQAQQVEATAPEAQPGLALPGQGVESQPAIEPPTPSTGNLAMLLGALRQGGLKQGQQSGP